MKSTQLVVKGNVQGVFMRMNIQKKAQELALAGWVRNKEDGTVEVLIQGDEKLVEALRSYIETSPGGSQVDEVVTSIIETEQYSTFDIVR